MLRSARKGPQDIVDISVAFPKGRPVVKGRYPSKWRVEQNPPATQEQFFAIKRHIETVAERHNDLNELRNGVVTQIQKLVFTRVTAFVSFFFAFIGSTNGAAADIPPLLIAGILSIFVFVFCCFQLLIIPTKLKEYKDRYFTTVVDLNLEEELNGMVSAATVRIVDISNKTWKFKITIERAETAVPYAYAGSEEPKPAIAIEEDYMAQDVKGLYP